MKSAAKAPAEKSAIPANRRSGQMSRLSPEQGSLPLPPPLKDPTRDDAADVICLLRPLVRPSME